MTTRDSGKKSTTSAFKRTTSGFRGARPMNEQDLLLAMQKVKKTGESARQFYSAEVERERKSNRANAVHAPNIDIQKLMAMAMAAAAPTDSADEEGADEDALPEMVDDE